MRAQLGFDFCDVPADEKRSPIIWLGAAQRALPGILQRLFEAPAGLIVDSVDAAPAVARGDILILRGRGESGFSVYARLAEDADDKAFIEELELAIRATEMSTAGDGQVRELALIGFRPGGIGTRLPASTSTGFERAIATIRHRDVRRHPAAVVAACVRLERCWPSDTPLLLRGLVLREHADALLRLGRPLAEWRPVAKEAAFLFDAAGRLALARRTMRPGVHGASGQLEIPFETVRRPKSPIVANLGYRVEKIFARRLCMAPSRPIGSPTASGDWQWRLVGTANLPDADVCRVLAGARGRTLGASAGFVVPSRRRSRRLRLRAGFETELAVLLGIPGRTGVKTGRYTARVHSTSCRISPWSAENPVGVLSEFMVMPSTPGRHVVEVELRTTSDRIARFQLDLSTDDAKILEVQRVS